MAGFLFYEDYYKVGKLIASDSERVKFYEAIFDRGLYGVQFPKTGNPSIDTAFIFAESLLKANEVKRENGKKGGRPKKQKTSGLSVVSTNDNGNANANANGNANVNSNENTNAVMPLEIASPDGGNSTANGGEDDDIDWEVF